MRALHVKMEKRDVLLIMLQSNGCIVWLVLFGILSWILLLPSVTSVTAPSDWLLSLWTHLEISFLAGESSFASTANKSFLKISCHVTHSLSRDISYTITDESSSPSRDVDRDWHVCWSAFLRKAIYLVAWDWKEGCMCPMELHYVTFKLSCTNHWK